ncbi:MAG: glycosyltransferase family 4 protein [Planctomycetaceae bacterium]|jgi:glycosyltransferase involved in cell wall biosynthesis|nr:glycosyltransferase family 4 protein [Planctomycetaceae bacterium]
MKILVVADYFFPCQPGGLARVAWDVAQALARRGHDVELVAAGAGDSAASTTTTVVEGVLCHLFRRPLFANWDPRRLTAAVAAYAGQVSRALAGKQFDVIHFHSIFTGAAVLRAMKQAPQRAALVYTVHSPVVQEQRLTWSQQGLVGFVNQAVGIPVARRMERRLLACAHATHVLSRFTANELAREHPQVRFPCQLIPHFFYGEWRRRLTRAEARSRLGWPSNRPALFTVRQLRHRYGIDDAITAVAPLAAAGRCTFHIAGDGPNMGKLRTQIDDSGCRESITLMGRLPDDTLQVGYQAADLFLLPTRALECFGLISLEAMSFGLPVLGTNVGAIPEVIGPVLPGFLSPPGDPEAFRAKITDYLDGRIIPPAEEVIRGHVTANYSELAVMTQYELLYERARATKAKLPTS